MPESFRVSVGPGFFIYEEKTMWEAISNILTSTNALQTIISIILVMLIIVVMIKTGMIRIRTKHVQVGKARSASDTERAIIREQCDFTHVYLMGLVSKIKQVTPDLLYDGYFTKYILEVAYDEFVRWITFNHIEDSEEYISTKQRKICSLVYSMGIRNEFKTAEFNHRMCNWVEEIIRELVRIRRVYERQGGQK